MDPKEIIEKVNEKVDKEELQAALAANDPDALKSLLESEGVTLTDEQLDYIAGGGIWGSGERTC